MSVGFSTGYHWQRAGMEWGVLLWASRGATAVTIDARVWVIAPHQAVWVPAGVGHAVRMSGRGTLRQVYVRPDSRRAFPSGPTAITVAPLLRELLRRIGAMGVLHDGVPVERRLFAVLRDEVAREARAERILADRSRELPMPADPRARRAAALVRAEVSLERSVAEIAGEAHASVRTLERLFRTETGLSLGAWRRRARVIHAMQLLADGATVTAAGLATGYATTSAFVQAFRREVGVTPGVFGRGTGRG
ncbi:MAG: helix-turn-helix transcriptional regulator [Gemmatimonadaceae bacterium]|nr:helix-turn-helix transcriptional regulator [Gemmatimonadaceae bacterium]